MRFKDLEKQEHDLLMLEGSEKERAQEKLIDDLFNFISYEANINRTSLAVASELFIKERNKAKALFASFILCNVAIIFIVLQYDNAISNFIKSIF